MANVRIKAASSAALIHLSGCLAVAFIAAVLVFLLWFPYPFDQIEGGRELFLLMVSIDVICGPLLTFVVFNPKKTRTELCRDVGIIVAMQLIALGYGLYTSASARPVFLAFEVDRFQVVIAADLNRNKLKDAEPSFRKLSFSGPKLIAVKVPTSSDPGYLASVELSMKGVPPYLRPTLWREYDKSQNSVRLKLRSLADLKNLNPNNNALIDDAIQKSGRSLSELGYLPVSGRSGLNWIALVSIKDVRLLSFAQVDGS